MIDRTDIEIIEQLKQKGRASMRDIAEKIDIAPSTASTRFQKLKEKSIIKGFKPVVDYEKLGFELTAVLEIQAEPNDIPELAERLENRNQIISFFEVTGTTDMILIGKFLDRKDLNQFVKDLQKTDGVSATETHIVLTSPKTHGEINLEKVKN
jgi:DNA-binding Lrp family transcriptional regulator